MKRSFVALLAGLFSLTLLQTQAHGALFGVLAPQESPVTLSPSINSIKVGESTQANPAGGSGDGALTVTGITPTICSVSTSGTILGISAGTCSFYATRGQSGTYLPRTSSNGSVTITGASTQSQSSSSSSAGISVGAGGPLPPPPPPDLRNAALSMSATGVPTLTWEAFSKGLIHLVSDVDDYFRAVTGNTLELADLTPGRTWQITIYSEDYSFSRSFKLSIPPTTPVFFESLAPQSLNGAYTLTWKPTSFAIAYRVTYSSASIKSTSMQVSSTQALIFLKSGEKTALAITAVGQGGVESKPAKLTGILSAAGPISYIAVDPNSKTIKSAASIDTLRTLGKSLPKKATVVINGFNLSKKNNSTQIRNLDSLLKNASDIIRGSRKDLVIKTVSKPVLGDKVAKPYELRIGYTLAIPMLKLSAG